MALEERRRYFRIDDEINLFYKKVDEKVLNETSYVSDSILSNCSLSTALQMASQESSLLMYRLEKNNPDIADYLKLLETKIDLLAQAITFQTGEFQENSTRNANISATGIAFDSEEQLEVGQYLEIKMLLVNCMAVIVVYGIVVYSKANEDNEHHHCPFTVGVDYINIKEQDRELLIRHVVKRQLQQIRGQRENTDNS